MNYRTDGLGKEPGSELKALWNLEFRILRAFDRPAQVAVYYRFAMYAKTFGSLTAVVIVRTKATAAPTKHRSRWRCRTALVQVLSRCLWRGQVQIHLGIVYVPGRSDNSAVASTTSATACGAYT